MTLSELIQTAHAAQNKAERNTDPRQHFELHLKAAQAFADAQQEAYKKQVEAIRAGELSRANELGRLQIAIGQDFQWNLNKANHPKRKFFEVSATLPTVLDMD